MSIDSRLKKLERLERNELERLERVKELAAQRPDAIVLHGGEWHGWTDFDQAQDVVDVVTDGEPGDNVELITVDEGVPIYKARSDHASNT